MSWLEFHKASELLAIEAEGAFRAGNAPRAAVLYAQAADHEQRALETVDPTKVRTKGITAVSAVSLWYKAAAYDRAEQLAYGALADPLMPSFAKSDLRNLLQAIWTEDSKKAANVSFLPGQVFVSVKGGDVITGGAPLDLIVEKVQTIQAMFYRTIEFVRDMPLRLRGGPIREIQESCRPWLFQAPPGSYQFSVAIQDPKQLDFFKKDVRPDLVARQFLEVLKATASDNQEQLEVLVPDADYRKVFLKLSRNLAPTGKTFDSIELHAAGDNDPIALTPEARTAINQVLRKSRQVDSQDSSAIEQEVVGVLRAVDLDKDFLDVTVSGHSLRVSGLGDAMDDVIGPMVNKPAKVRVIRDARGVTRFIDIELDD